MKKLIMLILSVLLMLTSVNPVCAIADYSPASDFSITPDSAIKYCEQCEEIMFTKLPEGATIKAFLWEGIRPLCKSVTEQL